jgi:phage gpG-like protein
MASIVTGLEKFVQYCERMSKAMLDPKDIAKRIGAYGVSSTQKRIASNMAPANSPLTVANKKGNNTLRDRGALHNSITRKTGDSWVAWGSNLKYALIQNEGGTITPKNAKMLAIPAGTRKLMRKFGETPKTCIDAMRSSGYSVWRSKSGKAIMAKGKAGKPFVLFILKESVTIPQRKFIDFDGEDQTNVLDMVEAWIDRI